MSREDILFALTFTHPQGMYQIKYIQRRKSAPREFGLPGVTSRSLAFSLSNIFDKVDI
jgi:hypothetical protein